MRKSGALSLLYVGLGDELKPGVEGQSPQIPRKLAFRGACEDADDRHDVLLCPGFEAPDAASMAPPGPEGSRTAPFRAAAQRRTGADGYFASRCKGASAPAENSRAPPLR